MGLNSIDADFNRPDDITNPFNFDKWQSTSSRTNECTMSAKYLEIVRYKSGLHHSKQLASLKTADIYSIISIVDFTGNAPKSTSIQAVR